MTYLYDDIEEIEKAIQEELGALEEVEEPETVDYSTENWYSEIDSPVFGYVAEDEL